MNSNHSDEINQIKTKSNKQLAVVIQTEQWA